jgi:beta-glucanase (GH16 family)
MISFSAGRSAAVLRKTHRKDASRFSFRALIRGVYHKLISLVLSVLAGLIFAVIVFLTFGIRTPLSWLPFNNTTTPVKQTTTNPKIVAAPTNPASSCPASQASNAPLFATCPSFIVDYSGQNKGSVNKRYFNVYTGKPPANNEAELYTGSAQNLRVENGNLLLVAQNDPKQGYTYTSARVDTMGKEDFLYGKLIVRAKLPTSIGTWPAIWLLPSNPRYAGLSPASDNTRYLNDGEIDIAESVGVEPHIVYGVAHSLAYPEDGPNRNYYSTISLPDNDAVYHDYEVAWTPTSLTFSIDSHSYYTYTKAPDADYRSWPYDQPFYLVMNLALGGTWAGRDTAHFPGDGIDRSALPAAIKVQSVRYYSYLGPH